MRQATFFFGIVATLALAADASENDERWRWTDADRWVHSCYGAWKWRQQEFARCSRAATLEGRFGDVVIRFVPEADRVEITATKGLGSTYERCVRETLNLTPCIFHPPRESSGAPESYQQVVAVPIGNPVPLLPAIGGLLERWQGYRQSSWTLGRWWKRRRLASVLPEDVQITSDGCLWFPATTNVVAGANKWLSQAGRVISPVWQRDIDAVLGRGVPHKGWIRLSEATFLSVMESGALDYESLDWTSMERGALGDRLCLIDVDDAATRQLQLRVDAFGQGWTGGLADVLTDPRVALPAGKRYEQLAISSDGICGIDEGGLLACAGQKGLGRSLRGRFTMLGMAIGRVCALTHEHEIWCERGDGVRDPARPERFVTMAVAGDHTCGITTEGSLRCWSIAGLAEATPAGRFSALAPSGGRCALRVEGGLVCWALPSPNASTASLDLKEASGPFQAVDGSFIAGCALGSDGSLLCWDNPASKPAIASEQRFREALAPFPAWWCGVTTDGALRCASNGRRSAPTPAGAGPYHGLVSGAYGYCGLTASGQAACWDFRWPRRPTPASPFGTGE